MPRKKVDILMDFIKQKISCKDIKGDKENKYLIWYLQKAGK